ncbi:MAG: cytochrome c [Rhodobacteraceae bacterium]|nr:cytochrome c [Paracoccaceae bacterium]
MRIFGIGRTGLAALAATALVAGAVLAQDAPFGMQIAARQGMMAYRALNIGVLAAMAKGEAPYDAAAAQKAADNLAAQDALDQSMLWPPGSDNSANPESTALAAMWAEGSGIMDKASAYADAVAAMQAAAGKDLDSLRAALGPLGGACGDCHKAFRVAQ